MFDYIDVFFALLAGVIFTIVMIVLDIPFDVWVLNLIIIMLLMLSTGFIYKKYIKVMLSDDDKKETEITEPKEVKDKSVIEEYEEEVVNNSFDDYDDDEEIEA